MSFAIRLCTAVFLLVGLSLNLAFATDYPNRPIRWIVPYPPAGTTDVLARIVEAADATARSGLARAMTRSFCVSADMAHAVHPNFPDRHESMHMPRIGQGPVIKTNAQQRYATDGATAARFRALCAEADVPVQDFVTRTDLACGSTIGPLTATRLGIATVDVGSPMLSMHSAREMCGAADVAMMVKALGRLFA